MQVNRIQKITWAGFVFASLFFVWGTASAHVPVLVEQESIGDITYVADPELSQAFYGEMNGYPHTYEIRTDTPFTLRAEILVPDIDSSLNIISGIIIRDFDRGGRVAEVARLHAQDALWEPRYEVFGGDSYRHGPVFESEVEAGVYRVEVHTPENIGKYVLVLGTREDMTIGYFELIRRMVGVKLFFEKSPLMVVQSPFVYVPLALMVSGILYWYLRKRRKNAV